MKHKVGDTVYYHDGFHLPYLGKAAIVIKVYHNERDWFDIKFDCGRELGVTIKNILNKEDYLKHELDKTLRKSK